jgi:hypothetical protein
MNRRFYILLTCMFLCGKSFARQPLNICGENQSGPFWPVKTPDKRYHHSIHGGFVEYFDGDSVIVNGNTYFRELKQYSNGRIDTLWLREKDGDVYVYDHKDKVEFLELSKNITPGYTWEKYDGSWRYTVVDSSSTLITPYCHYTSLLNIKAEPLGKTKNNYSSYYNLYYKRGLGQVALNVNGKGYSFLSIDKSLVIEKGLTAPGCENLATEKEKYECMQKKISQHISNNFEFKGRLKKGMITVHLTIDENGNVEEATPGQTIKNAEKQMEEAVRVVKLLKFVPRTINGHAVRTPIVLPVNF